MNKNKLFKFGLTLVSAAVLAACSSGGSSDGAKKEAEKQAQMEMEAKKAAAVAAAKAKAEAEAKAKAAEEAAAKAKAAAEKAAAEKVAAEKAAAEAAAKKAEEEAAAAKKAAEEAAAAAKAAADHEEKLKSREEVGHKFVQKVNSNLNVGTGTAVNSDASTSTTAMTLSLDPSLDTVVVAVPLDENGKVKDNAPQAYLEDYDFRGNTDNTKGTHVLDHVYVGKVTKNGVDRGTETLTKTKTAGTDKGVAVVYEKGRLNYTDYDGKSPVADPKVKRTQEYLKAVTLDDNGQVVAVQQDGKFVVGPNTGSLTEVYGKRTFVEGNSLVDEELGKEEVNNAPFLYKVKKDDELSYADGQLNHVQYGRVTSNLSAVAESGLKDGKSLGKYETKVAGFGHYGKNGTENHYFYRGLGDTKYSATLVNDLNKVYYGSDKEVTGSLQYQGHAVTYNIDHEFSSTDSIPNAIGYKQELVSGTHVFANVDLATKNVTGQLYDVWRYGNRHSEDFSTKKVELAKFEGKLENNGSIQGSSTRVADGDKGSFNANLYGGNAEELGGAIRSSESLQGKQWGAVFGAEIQNPLYVPKPDVLPEQPKKPKEPKVPTKVPAWGESTDKQDTNSPIK